MNSHAANGPRQKSASRKFSWALLLAGALILACAYQSRRMLAGLRLAQAAVAVQHERELARLRAENADLARELRRKQAEADAASQAAAKPAEPVNPVIARGKTLVSVMNYFSQNAYELRGQLRAMDAMRELKAMIPDMARARGAVPPTIAPGEAEYLPFQVDVLRPLPARFGELFALDDAAVARLQEKLDSVRTKFEAAILTKATIGQSSPESAVLVLQAVPEMPDLRDEFIRILRETLGEDSFRALFVLNGGLETDPNIVAGITASFDGLGKFDRMVSISHPPGMSYTWETEIWVTPTEKKSRGTGRSLVVAPLRAVLGPAFKLLPEGF
jgi:cell division protein FtsB